MNGAENLLNSLLAGGIEVCFTNPGTSEMHLVSAIGNSTRMRAVLCLFEGVTSGAADGYARISGKPALTLLHLGPGFANSMANQHNAMRAHVPLVNVIGDHATYHLQYDTPLTSDITAYASISSSWVRSSRSANDLAQAAAEAVQASMQGAGCIATLIVPANHAWETATGSVAPLPLPKPEKVARTTINQIASFLLNGKRTALYLGGHALQENSLLAAGRIGKACNADLFCEYFPARLQRGAGRVKVVRLPYFAEHAAALLRGYEQIVLAGAKAPVSFFAYPAKPGWLAPENCEIRSLCEADQDIRSALEAVAGRIGAPETPEPAGQAPAEASPKGTLTPTAIGQSLSALMPADAIVSDEAVTCGPEIFQCTENAARHDWLGVTGGAIGLGLPLSLGAAIASPHRKVIALEADGSAMYTPQALWSMAREQADITVIIMNNSSYAILNVELAMSGGGQPTNKTLSMLNLGQPNINWLELSGSMGVPATRATTAEEFHSQLAAALRAKGPRLIEAMVVQTMP